MASNRTRNAIIVMIVGLALIGFSIHKVTDSRSTLRVSIGFGDPSYATGPRATYDGAAIDCLNPAVNAHMGSDAPLWLGSIRFNTADFTLSNYDGSYAGSLSKIDRRFDKGGGGCYINLIFRNVTTFANILVLKSRNGAKWTIPPERLKWKDVLLIGDGANL